jgi:histidinol phosphatase-like enzyme
LKTFLLFSFLAGIRQSTRTIYPSMAQKQQRNLGKISLVNGDKHMSVVATAVIITERGVVKIKDETKGTYVLCGCDKPSLCMCVRWVHQYRDIIQKQSVYINDPDAAAGYAANVAKAEKEKAEKASKWQQPPSRQYHQQPMTPKPQAPLRTSLSLPQLPRLLF